MIAIGLGVNPSGPIFDRHLQISNRSHSTRGHRANRQRLDTLTECEPEECGRLGQIGRHADCKPIGVHAASELRPQEQQNPVYTTSPSLPSAKSGGRPDPETPFMSKTPFSKTPHIMHLRCKNRHTMRVTNSLSTCLHVYKSVYRLAFLHTIPSEGFPSIRDRATLVQPWLARAQ